MIKDLIKRLFPVKPDIRDLQDYHEQQSVDRLVRSLSKLKIDLPLLYGALIIYISWSTNTIQEFIFISYLDHENTN